MGSLRDGQFLVSGHHLGQFGDVPLSVRGMKLGEEAGEVQAALVRHLSRRDGREWLPEVRSEIGDVMVALMALAGSLGLDLEEITDEAVERFCARTWDVTRWGDGEEVARG